MIGVQPGANMGAVVLVSKLEHSIASTISNLEPNTLLNF